MIHWNASPELISFGPITIRWYGILFAAAFLLGFQIMQWIYKKEKRSVTELDSLFMFMFIGTIVGARLGHCLFYDPAFYLSHPIEIFKIWKGGLASHGGAIGILLSLYFYTRKQGNLSYLWLLDRLAIPTALGGTFIRIGNFMNSEIVGIPTNGWWAVVFERVDMIPRHAVQLYEATAYGIVFIVLLLTYRSVGNKYRDGMLIGLFLILVFSARFLLEFVKTPQAAYNSGLTFSVGQLLSIPFVVIGLFLTVRSVLMSKNTGNVIEPPVVDEN